LFFFLVLLVHSGCAVPFQRGAVFDEINLSEFPIDRAELLVLSYKSYRYEGPASSVARSLIAAQNVMLRDPDNELANYFAARATMWLIEFGGEDIDRDKLADQGYKWSLKLLENDPNRGEYYFLTGVHLGFIIKQSISPSLIKLRKVHGYFKEAAKINPYLEYGGPLRALGALLIKSPPWPTGVGDIDQGIEVLEKACALFPHHPANHLYLAQAYIEDKRWKDGENALLKTLELTKNKSWGVPGKYWRNLAKSDMRKIKKEVE